MYNHVELIQRANWKRHTILYTIQGNCDETWT